MNMKIREINNEQADVIIETREDIGLFYLRVHDNIIVGIDNSTGDAWVEEFDDLEECKKWLLGEEAVDRYGTEL